MPVLTRSASATSLSRPQLTPQTPPSADRRALVEMTPLPSLLDKMLEAAKRSRRSNSLQLKSKTDDDPFVLSPILEEPGRPSSCLIETYDVQQPSDTPTNASDEPEIVIHQPSVASDPMDYEDTPFVFSGPIHLSPSPVSAVLPPAPTSVPPLVREEVMRDLLPNNPIDTYLGPPATLPPTNHEPLLLSELTNSTVSSHIIYYNTPSISAGLDSNLPPQGQAPSQPPGKSEGPLQMWGIETPSLHFTSSNGPCSQVSERITVPPQYPTFPQPTYPIAPPILAASAPGQTTMEPVVLPALTHTLPTAPTFSGPCPRRQEQNWLRLPSALAEDSYRTTFAPQMQPQRGLENPLIWWFQPRPYVSSWRIREIERQKEMDRIAEPYLARLREISLQKKADAEARALSGRQRIGEGESENPLGHLRGGDKEIQGGLKEVRLRRHSEEKRQTRKDAHEARRWRRSSDDVSREVQERDGRRKSSYHRPKPYTVPHPAARSPRRMHAMPGGLDSDDLAWDQTGFTSDVLWKGLRSAVNAGYRLLAQD